MLERKHLFLLRHAKSSWDDPQLADHDRPLAARGRKAAKLIGAHLRDEGISPSLVLCSSARRARETLELLGVDGEVEPELYGASVSGLLERLHRLPDSAASAMLIGHNPAIQNLALTLARGGAERAEVELKFPTGALVALRFSGGWAQLRSESCDLYGFVKPRDLG